MFPILPTRLVQEIKKIEYYKKRIIGILFDNIITLLQILVLLITGISTMLQMKDHHWILYLKNESLKIFRRRTIQH